MPSKIITSKLVISHPFTSGEFLDACREFNYNYDFRHPVTYRRYILGTNPITGDMDKSVYNEYEIYADVQSGETIHKWVEAGFLSTEDVIMFLPARIQYESDGTFISNEFRPQIQDEVTHEGVTYKIDRINFEDMAGVEIFAKCICKRVKSTQPEVIWNANYDGVNDMRGGFT